MKLKHQVCIITGGVAAELEKTQPSKWHKREANLVIVGRNRVEIRGLLYLKSNQSREQRCITHLTFQITMLFKKMVDDVQEKFDRIDVLVNNAGHSSHNRRLLNTTPERNTFSG